MFKYLGADISFMKTMDFNEMLRSRGISVFTIGDAAKIIGKSRAYASKFLGKDREVSRAENGIYYSKNASEYEVASNIVFPSYVSMASALMYYGMTTQLPRYIYVVALAQHRSITGINGRTLVFKKTKPKMMFGYRKEGAAFIAEPEKAIIDSLYFRQAGYAGEAVDSGKAVDAEKLAEYALMTGNRVVISKAGLLLEDSGHGKEAARLYPRRSRLYARLLASASALERKWGVAYD
jgi:predicted transcriptional regulator of viral defense system